MSADKPNCECGRELPWHLADIAGPGGLRHTCLCDRHYVVDDDSRFAFVGRKRHPFRELALKEEASR